MVTVVEFPAKDLNEESPGGMGPPASATRCLRCGGLLVTEWCFDLFNDDGHLDITVQRCVQCGERVDPVILSNRRLKNALC